MLKGLLRKGKKESDPSDFKVTVEIFDTVMERINNSVLRSDIEEGGKFLGKIRQASNEVIIRVETYMDSGPRVNNSACHLHPDGEYQEALFRVVEAFDPEIEHLGTWHSHHCNGLKELSGGDIRGYISSVNNAQYNLDYFFALLVTGIVRNRVQSRCFLFRRNQNEMYELDESNVHMIAGTSSVEALLQEAERMAFAYRSQSGFGTSHSLVRTTAPEVHSKDMLHQHPTIESLKELRGKDHQWILQQFPSAKALQSRKDGTICWQWSVSFGRKHKEIDIRYKHPTIIDNPASVYAQLEISYNGKPILFEKVHLNADRFQEITGFIREAISRAK